MEEVLVGVSANLFKEDVLERANGGEVTFILYFSPKIQLFSPKQNLFLQKLKMRQRTFRLPQQLSRSAQKACVCAVVTDGLHLQYCTNSRGAFSVGGRAMASIFGQARIQDCSDWM